MNKLFKILTVAVAVLMLSSIVLAKAPDNKAFNSLKKTTAVDLEVVDGNRIYNFMNNRGAWCTHNNPNGYGMQWPGESHISANYASGVWLGGKVDGEIRTACAEFTYEFQPGNIGRDGLPTTPDDNFHQIVKINKGDLLDEGFSNPDYDVWVNDYASLGAPIQRDENGNPIESSTGKYIPDMIGDQMLWCVYNDAAQAPHSALFSTAPIGLEVQQTVWVFNRPDAFGDMMFMKFLLVNKGQAALEDAFIGLWFDIDLGDSNDDLVFCDTTLSLGAFWNDGDDTDYGATPPACGADFFQGPIVASPGDTAYVSGKAFPDYKNLGMYSFSKYIRGGSPAVSDPETALEAYNFMTGLDGLGNEVIDKSTGLPTRYANISDPETGEGWVDGVDEQSADRRMLMNAGPFVMDVWVDTNGDGLAQVGEPGVQEVVAVYMITQGTGAKNSATRLKQVDELAQLAYNLNFALPETPPNPQVEVHSLDKELILTWSGEVESYSALDRVDVDGDGNPTYYTFQGYNIYQANTPVVGPSTNMVKLATYDVADGVGDITDFVFSEEFGENVEATVQRASDAGIQRMYQVTSDALNGGVALSNWNSYWFIVTAYGYNELGIPKILESPFTTIECIPMPAAGGAQANAENGQLIAEFSADTVFNATHTATGSASDGEMKVVVVDPTQVTGKDYQVTFENDPDLGLVFNIDRMDNGTPTRVLEKQTNQTGDDGYTVVDGLMIKSIGPPNTFSSFQVVANASGPLSLLESCGAAWYDFPAPLGSDENGRPSGNQQVGDGLWLIQQNTADDNYAFEDFIGRVSGYTGGALVPDHGMAHVVPYDYEIRFTAEGSKALFDWYGDAGGAAVHPVPFELWNIGIGTPDDPSDDYKIMPWISDGDANFQFNLLDDDHHVSGGDDDPYTDGIYWVVPLDNEPGTSGYDRLVAAVEADPATAGNDYLWAYYLPGAPWNSVAGLMRMVFVNWNGGSVADGVYNQDMPEEGTVFRILTTKPNSPSDMFTFSTSGFEPTSGTALAQSAAQKVNIYPNPYFGQNPAETTPLDRFVTITHLPEDEDVKIRIFTISGSLVKTIEKLAVDGKRTAQWDLRNDFNVPVASGMYLIHIDMGDLGEKVLKAAVFLPEERLDKF
jgi:hypothetical protein